MNSWIRVLSALLWCCCATVAAIAAQTPPSAVRGTWFLSVDNDVLNGSDDHYTSGIQFGWVSGYLDDFNDAPAPGFLVRLLRKLPQVNETGRQRFVSYSLSHRFFTPSDTSIREHIPGDMPYSALLLGTITAGGQNETKMDAFSLIAGIAGPSALGEEVQREFHAIIGSEKPLGWDNQIHDEPVLNFDYEHRRRLVSLGSRRGWGGDFIGQAAVAAGNLMTSATFGLGGRWGWRVPDDFGLPPQFFGEETIGSRPFSDAAGDRGVWLFALVNASAFANAIFWDGNTFRESHSIDYEHWIARAYLGVRLRYRQWGLSVAYVTTTVPWTNPDNRDRQRYGRVGVTFSY